MVRHRVTAGQDGFDGLTLQTMRRTAHPLSHNRYPTDTHLTRKLGNIDTT